MLGVEIPLKKKEKKEKMMSLRELWTGEGVAGKWLYVSGAAGGVWAESDGSGGCLHPLPTTSWGNCFACLG